MSRITPMQAIRKKCLDCCVNQFLEIKTCPVLDCPLWKFRLGLHPFTKKNKQNLFLEPSYFIGLENLTALQTLDLIMKKEVKNE